LNVDSDGRNSLVLRLDDSGCMISKAVSGRKREFADRDATASFDVDAVTILDEPASVA